MRHRILLSLLGLGLFFTACDSGDSTETNSGQNAAKASYFDMASPARGSVYSLGDTVLLKLSAKPNAPEVDSVEVLIDGQKVATFTGTEYAWPTEGATVGRKIIRLMVYGGSEPETVRTSTTLHSNLVPEVWGYRVINRYPHDRQAFTQGLEYYQGYLYEGTGQKGASSLRKVDILTGSVVQQHDLAPEYFGEGITRVGDELVQITWQSRTGWVYDLATFSEKRSFNYPTEGWGIAHNGEHIVMSDGTNRLYLMNPEDFTQQGQLEVYDHEGPVKELNELEIINGEVYANIWTTDRIARIDLATGRVLSYIEMTGLLPQRTGQEDVLNGIAHDAATGRTWVTGKYWPNLFEVAFVPTSAQ